MTLGKQTEPSNLGWNERTEPQTSREKLTQVAIKKTLQT